MEIEEVAPSWNPLFRLRDERKLARDITCIFFFSHAVSSFPRSRDNKRIFGLVEKEIKEILREMWPKRPSSFFKLAQIFADDKAQQRDKCHPATNGAPLFRVIIRRNRPPFLDVIADDVAKCAAEIVTFLFGCSCTPAGIIHLRNRLLGCERIPADRNHGAASAGGSLRNNNHQ